MSRSKFQLAVGIALIGVLLLATVAHAQGGPAGPNGRWTGPDRDSSTVSLSLSGPPSGPYTVTWTDDSWTLCDDTRFGIGRGSAILKEGIVEMEVDFECFRTAATAHLEAQYTFDEGAQTLTLIGTNPNAPESFSRPGGP